MNPPKAVLAILTLITLAGCAWRGESPASGAEVGISSIGSSSPVWLAAPRPGLSAVGKDYLFVGPMSVNQDGSAQTYLWLAVGTTIDRQLTGAAKPVLNTVVLRVDGTLMTFDLIPWNNGSPYAPAINSYASYAARVTSSQIERLATAEVVDAYVTDANGRSPVYSVVAGEPGDWLRSDPPRR